MAEVLLAGFLIGMLHAFQMDHLAAVLSFSVQDISLSNFVRKSVSWGIGHTTTLILIVVPFFWMGYVVLPNFEILLEAIVGAVLIFIGIRLILKIKTTNIHRHSHIHNDGSTHSHFHMHKFIEYQNHNKLMHIHKHQKFISIKTLVVGLLHGLAGSAALLVFMNSAIAIKWWIVPVVAIFGIGSVVGMVFIFALVSIPLGKLSRKAKWIFINIQYLTASFSIGFGFFIISSCAMLFFNS